MEKGMMKMSNSPLVTYTKLSPNHSGPRKQKIDTITPHCIVGYLSLKKLGDIFTPKARQASSNYGIDPEGKVGMYVEEGNRSWCTSSNANDQRAVTIEIASDTKAPYKIKDKTMDGLIELCIDICKRNDIPKLLWKADKSLIGKVDRQNITVHRWFNNTQCPGDYIYSQLGYVADAVNLVLVKKPEIVIPATYAVKVTADTLYVRKAPGTKNPVVGTVHKDQIVTIVEEGLGLGASKWGRLQSVAGWVSLDFCTKVK
jgi:hypothetical protein